MNPAAPCQPPAESAIQTLLPGAHFFDAWQVEASEPELSALGQFLKAAEATPKWVDGLMQARNQLVRLAGLKHLGGLSGVHMSKAASDYRPGERVGIFTLFANEEDEALLGDKDKHLEVTLSVHKTLPQAGEPVIVTVTTVVHLKNFVGRIYMIPVAPIHKLIVPAVLKAIARSPHTLES